MGATRVMTLREVHETMLQILDSIDTICSANNLRFYLVGGTLLGAVRHKGFIPWDDDMDIAMPRPDFERFLEVAPQALPPFLSLVYGRDDFDVQHYTAKIYDKRTVLKRVNGLDLEDRGVRVDVFPLDGLPGGGIRKWIHFWLIHVLYRVSNVAVRRIGISGGWKDIVSQVLRKLIPRNVVTKLRQYADRLMKKYTFDQSEQLCNYLGRWGRKEIFPKKWVGSGTRLEFEGRYLPAFQHYEAYLRNVYGDFMRLPPKEAQQTSRVFAWREN